MVKLNKYCTNLIDLIDLEADPRFVEIEKESIAICQKNLIDYLQAFIKLYSKGIENIADDDIHALNDLSTTLLGLETLGDCSPKIMMEALYYIRLFQLEDSHMLALSQTLDTYDNVSQVKAIMKLNSLIMMNISCFGAGSKRPLFSLSPDDDFNKDALDLEVAILFLIRNMNDINMSLAQPVLSSPLDLLNVPPAREEGKPIQQIQQIEDRKRNQPAEKEQSLITMPEMIFLGLTVVLIAAAVGTYLTNPRLLSI